MSKIALRKYLREIETLIDQGHIVNAVVHCQHILESYPKYLETYRLMGKAYLETHRNRDAADIFQRVLLAVPDDFVSHLGMSIVCEEQKDLNGAIWHMERAFEINSTNNGVQADLRRLIGKRDGTEPQKIYLTRGALAQIYAKDGEFQQAIAEAKSVLAEDKSRNDMVALLARVYFRAGMKNEAVELCIDLLKQYPYSLDGNRILVEILPGTSMAQGVEQYRRRIQSLDPYAQFSTTSVFDTASVPDDAVMFDKLILGYSLNTPDLIEHSIQETSSGKSQGDVLNPEQPRSYISSKPIDVDKMNTNDLPERKLRVFLCHSSGDKPEVKKLYHRLLTKKGIEPWLDEEDLNPGENWNYEIKRAVQESDVVLVCLSKSSINKEGYVQKEIRFALDIAGEKPDGTIFLIPVKLEDCIVPERLNEWHWLNYFQDGAFERLMRSLRKRAETLGIKIDRNIVPAAGKWHQYLHETAFFSANNKNLVKVNADFLTWMQCTILVWVLVPPKGTGLRDSQSNRYILAHSTGATDENGDRYYNQFCIRYSSVRNRWEVQYSNGKPEYPYEYLTKEDDFRAGWHQFMITWNNHLPEIILMIDNRKNDGGIPEKYLDYWPNSVAENVLIGGWDVDADSDSYYCETKLAHLWIAPIFSDGTSEIVQEHAKLKPNSG